MKNLLLLLTLISSITFGQKVDTVRAVAPFKDGHTHDFKYEVYSERGEAKSPAVIFSSQTKKVSMDGVDYLLITHKWGNGKSHGEFYSIVEEETFRPIVHIRNTMKGKEAYRFYDDKLVGLDSAKNNLEAGYKLLLTEPIFNFELDLELFSRLPLKDEFKAVVRFFHPGSNHGGPEWYLVEVERSELLTLPNKKVVDTWVLYMDYQGMQPTRFWYTKNTQEFVKMEGEYKGMKIYKKRVFE